MVKSTQKLKMEKWGPGESCPRCGGMMRVEKTYTPQRSEALSMSQYKCLGRCGLSAYVVYYPTGREVRWGIRYWRPERQVRHPRPHCPFCGDRCGKKRGQYQDAAVSYLRCRLCQSLIEYRRRGTEWPEV